MSDTDIEYIPVSWLNSAEDLSDESLFLVSNYDSGTETQYMSKHVKWSDMVSKTGTTLGISNLRKDIDSVSSYTQLLARKDQFNSNWIVCSTAGTDPYVISAIHQKDGNIDNLRAFTLSAGMDVVFKKTKFDIILAKNISSDQIQTINLSSTNINVENGINVVDLSCSNITSDTLTVKIIRSPLNRLSVLSQVGIYGQSAKIDLYGNDPGMGLFFHNNSSDVSTAGIFENPSGTINLFNNLSVKNDLSVGNRLFSNYICCDHIVGSIDDGNNYVRSSLENVVTTNLTGNVGQMAYLGFWSGTQEEYDSLETKDPNTLYFIKILDS